MKNQISKEKETAQQVSDSYMLIIIERFVGVSVDYDGGSYKTHKVESKDTRAIRACKKIPHFHTLEGFRASTDMGPN